MNYYVQFTTAVDNPENNVRMTRKEKSYCFEVPINLPDAHNLGLAQLVQAAGKAKMFTVLTGLNNNTGSEKRAPVISAHGRSR